MTAILPGTEIEMTPTFVEYRCKSGPGTRVVRIFLENHHNPRVIAQTFAMKGSRLEVQPMTISLAEVLEYVNDALKRTGHSELSVSAIASLINP